MYIWYWAVFWHEGRDDVYTHNPMRVATGSMFEMGLEAPSTCVWMVPGTVDPMER